MRFLCSILLFMFLSASKAEETASPFKWMHEQDKEELSITTTVSENSYLYKDRTEIKISDPSGKAPIMLAQPRTIREKDPFNEEHDVYPAGIHVWNYSLEGVSSPLKVSIEYQGCSKKPPVCLMPQDMHFEVDIDGKENPLASNNETLPPENKKNISWENSIGQFSVSGRTEGYLGEKDFIGFLEKAESGGAKDRSFFGSLESRNIIVAMVLILVGGLALNLTPCVLPMIPINLAIIGAGSKAESKRKGFILGAIYGSGITVVYGLLGVFTIVTGSTFGAINASPIFNFVIGLVFIVLSLAMFDVFTIDFSRFQKAGNDGGKGGIFTVFVVGGISAILAGACVAPVVIAVLLFSSFLVSKGNYIGLLLPFVLGFGMALPWPFAGAGIALLPKPGKWMLKVKYAFGVLIMLISFYYLHLGYSILAQKAPSSPIHSDWFSSLPEAIAESQKTGKPLFIDFYASWCKNCVAMDETTFRSSFVIDKFNGYVKLKFSAENPNAPATHEVLSYFNVLGFPTFIVLKPESKL